MSAEHPAAKVPCPTMPDICDGDCACPSCGHDGHDNWFDRSICPEPCGSMHTRCRNCGHALGGCLYEDDQRPVVSAPLRRMLRITLAFVPEKVKLGVYDPQTAEMLTAAETQQVLDAARRLSSEPVKDAGSADAA